ncbi:MAG: carotenoid biosynthesis protein [Microscillaceae bacterium]|nr:carotenoid biosynthesis protein [Microscillaceae bacterium]MDW8460987.1 carotenoid biosynthesis protein [Cytophagales bacterium]
MKNSSLTRSWVALNSTTFGTYLVIAMYVVGFIGLTFEGLRPFFEPLIPLNLIGTLAILLFFHQEWNRTFVFVACIVALAGFWVEVLGVQTKQIFGDYQYEYALGLKLWDVPVVIACNWLLLVYATSGMVYTWQIPKNFMPATAALLMVGLDFWIEPVAIKYGFWSWKSNTVPLQNYVAWFLVSWGFTWLFFNTKFSKYNPLALTIYLANLGFFLAHNFVIWLKK